MLMSNSQRLRARVRSAVKWMVVIPAGAAFVVWASLNTGYWLSFAGAQ